MNRVIHDRFLAQYLFPQIRTYVLHLLVGALTFSFDRLQVACCRPCTLPFV